MNIPRMIIQSLEVEYGLEEGALYRRSNTGRIPEARAIAYYLIREITFLTYQEIGRLFGRTHTAILYGYNRIHKELDSFSYERKCIRICSTVTKYLQYFNIY